MNNLVVIQYHHFRYGSRDASRNKLTEETNVYANSKFTTALLNKIEDILKVD